MQLGGSLDNYNAIDNKEFKMNGIDFQKLDPNEKVTIGQTWIYILIAFFIGFMIGYGYGNSAGQKSAYLNFMSEQEYEMNFGRY